VVLLSLFAVAFAISFSLKRPSFFAILDLEKGLWQHFASWQFLPNIGSF
jgi:hypothetical protein